MKGGDLLIDLSFLIAQKSLEVDLPHNACRTYFKPVRGEKVQQPEILVIGAIMTGSQTLGGTIDLYALISAGKPCIVVHGAQQLLLPVKGVHHGQQTVDVIDINRSVTEWATQHIHVTGKEQGSISFHVDCNVGVGFRVMAQLPVIVGFV